MNDLIKWKNESNGRTALLIEGARRIGKSTTVRLFAEQHYRSYILINFSTDDKEVRSYFENMQRIDIFFQNLSTHYGVQLFERESLIVFDEVQSFPRARELIKLLVADGRYDYVETGSLISIRENIQNIVIPSEEESLRMHPLSFPEFLLAAGEEQLLNRIRSSYAEKQPLPDALHKLANHLLREYMLVGGMPQVVVAYFENHRDFFKADREKRQILHLYQQDIRRIASQYQSKVSTLFDYIPSFLSSHEKKVHLAQISKGSTYNDFDEPLFWLQDSQLCNLAYRCTDPNIGFGLSLDHSSVKCYLLDTGLLVAQTFSAENLSDQQFYHAILSGKIAINEGMFHENLVAQMLTYAGKELFFYSHYNTDLHRSDLEIDFMLSLSKLKHQVIPIEVKSSTRYRARSFDKFKERFRQRTKEGIIVHPKQLEVEGAITKVPSYMFFCVLETLSSSR